MSLAGSTFKFRLGLVAVTIVGLILTYALYQGMSYGISGYLSRQASDQIAQGEVREALRLIDQATAFSWDHPHSLRLATRKAFLTGDFERAARLAEYYVSELEDDAEGLALWAWSLEELGRRVEARSLYEQLSRRWPHDPTGPLGLARLGERGPLSDLLDPRPEGPVRGISLLHLEDDLGSQGYGSAACAKSLLKARRIGANAVSLRLPVRQRTVKDPELEFDVELPGGESVSAIRRTVRDAHALGLRVMLKPHVMLDRLTEKEWRGVIRFEDPVRAEIWWAGYRSFIHFAARLAAEEQIEILCLGVELRGMITSSPDRWRDLISEVRSIYRGELTYAANWYEEFTEVGFWDLVDYIGVQFFFPISDIDSPSLDELRRGLEAPAANLAALAELYGKPILLTEVGFKSTPGACHKPWVWPEPGSPPDYDLQARAYRAILEVFTTKPWFAGLYWWNWLARPEPGHKFRHDFTPQGKPAEAVLREYWTLDQ